MAQATQCDRCDDLFEGEPEKRVFDEHPRDHAIPTSEGQFGEELCQSCADEHDAFMDGRSLAPEFDRIGAAGDVTLEVGDHDPISVTDITYTGSFMFGPSPYKNDKPDLPEFMTTGGANY